MTISATATTTNPFAALTTSTTASSPGNSSSNLAAGNAAAAQTASNSYNTFLTLLTTQLQHQDPLNPTNTDQFTSEMIQLSGVEQELQTNQTLASMATDLNTISAANGLGYIGKTVSASGATVPIQNGSANWTYDLNSAAQNVALSVKDSSGNTVWTGSGDASSGQHSFSWNGATASSGTLSSGDYTLVVAATDASGNPVTTTTGIVGTVTGVDTSTGSTDLKIGDVTVPVSDVTNLTN